MNYRFIDYRITQKQSDLRTINTYVGLRWQLKSWVKKIYFPGFGSFHVHMGFGPLTPTCLLGHAWEREIRWTLTVRFLWRTAVTVRHAKRNVMSNTWMAKRVEDNDSVILKKTQGEYYINWAIPALCTGVSVDGDFLHYGPLFLVPKNPKRSV